MVAGSWISFSVKVKNANMENIKFNTIYNEDCFVTMQRTPDATFDTILTSPFYNTPPIHAKGKRISEVQVKPDAYMYVRYDVIPDYMSNDEYCDFTVKLFNEFDRILKPNGQILYNMSYGSSNTECMFLAVNAILTQTNFTLADTIVWKKRNAMPVNTSRTKLTRIYELVFVFVRKDEFLTFHCNKKQTSVRSGGQKMYESIQNYIEAPNNDGPCPYNKATFSSELCEKLMAIYTPPDGIVYDPFMGTGTTAVACKRAGRSYVGSEISVNQCKWAGDRLAKIDTVATTI